MKTLRYEFKTCHGFLYDTREDLVKAKLHGIGLANDLKTPVTVVRVSLDEYSSQRYTNVVTYKPTRS